MFDSSETSIVAMRASFFLLLALIAKAVSFLPLGVKNGVSLRPASLHLSESTYDRNAWLKGWTTCEQETAVKLESPLVGSIPKDIDGTYFRNGHAKFNVGKEKILHPFDADGMVSAITFKGGQATFRNRYVITKGYKKERMYKKIMYRGVFGTKRKGMFSNFGDLKHKNVANTNIIYWGERLLALWEGGLPHRMEPDSLRTLSTYRYKGLLPKGGNFGAHARICTNSNQLVNFGTTPGLEKSDISCYEIPADFKTPEDIKQRVFTVPGLPFFHDFIVTKNYFIFNQAPLKIDPIPFALGLKGAAECMHFDAGKPAMIYFVPRDGVSDIIQIPVDSHFNFHFANGYDDEETGEVVFDMVKCDRMQLGTDSTLTAPVWETVDYATDVPYSKLIRYTFESPKTGSTKYTCSTLSETQVDFVSVAPSVSCKKHRYVYGSSGSDNSKSTPVQGLIKIDCETSSEVIWIGEKHEFLGENIFIPRENSQSEDDGYVLGYLFNGQTNASELVIFDAQNIAQGPILRQPLPFAVPFGLHGSFAPGLTFESENIIRRHKACKSLDSKAGWNEMEGGFSGLGLKYLIED